MNMSSQAWLAQDLAAKPDARAEGGGTTVLRRPLATRSAHCARGRPCLRLLEWAFTLFNSVRVLSYLPTLWAIQAHGDSSQHSLWTWGTWLGANLTMALWLYEQNGQRMNRAVLVNASNALMCTATCMLIAVHRW
jgi:hypothetical protein